MRGTSNQPSQPGRVRDRRPASNDPGFADPELAAKRGQLIDAEHRNSFLRDACFKDLKLRNPSWDMLVELMSAEQSGRKVSVGDLCNCCDVAESTALRLLNRLIERGYAERYRDLIDQRRIWISLTAKGRRSFDAYTDWFKPN